MLHKSCREAHIYMIDKTESYTEVCLLKRGKATLLKCIAAPLLVGAVSAFVSGGGMRMIALLDKPPLSPPGWLFPLVWTVLYTFMGIASYLVLTPDAARSEEISEAMDVYIYQLIVNFLWPVFFFNFKWYLFSFFWLILLWVLIIVMLRRFRGISKAAFWLILPYLAWVTFAGYLNLGIWWLNQGHSS